MSKRQEKLMSLVAAKGLRNSLGNYQKLAKELLNDGMHGICFSLFEEGQKPGDPITETQIRRRLEILKPHTKWIRTFSCTEGNELIPPLAKEYGIKTLVGAWLSDDLATNDEEIESLINLTKQGYVDIAAVGNEVLYRKELSEAELLDYINQVKQAIPGTPVGYVDAYYEFTERPALTEVCDVILANCYPYWEGCHIDYSFLYMKEMYQQAVKAAKGKKVIITETGWPSEGGAFEGSEANRENYLKYFTNAQQWSLNEDIEMFYFSSFDESWKTGDEGDVGAYWGLWDKDEVLKF
ncbi:glycosyl hydrolase family 17 protein [Bacteroidia bacterium]|nr:glycosyl hydrolase family 17 protein [Bacteroidia bacterium]